MQQVDSDDGSAMSEYIEFREQAAAGFVLAGAFVAAGSVTVRDHLVPIVVPPALVGQACPRKQRLRSPTSWG